MALVTFPPPLALTIHLYFPHLTILTCAFHWLHISFRVRCWLMFSRATNKSAGYIIFYSSALAHMSNTHELSPVV